VHLVQMGKKQLLWYEAPPKVHAALLRGTTADLDGNISFEKEALYLDSLNMVCGLTAHMSQCSMCCKADLVLAQEHSGCCQAWSISRKYACVALLNACKRHVHSICAAGMCQSNIKSLTLLLHRQ